MPRPPSQDLLDAVELIQLGKTPAELKEMGYKHDMSYRAARIAKAGLAFAPTPPSSGNGGKSTKRLVLSDTSPNKRDKTITPMAIGQVGGTTDYITQVPTIKRMRYPEFLSKAKFVLQRELHWPIQDMPDEDILDSIIYFYLRDRGFLLDAYYKVESVQELRRISHVSAETGEITPLVEEVDHATGPRTEQSRTDAPGGHAGDSQHGAGEGSGEEGEAGGDEIQRRRAGQDGGPIRTGGEQDEPA